MSIPCRILPLFALLLATTAFADNGWRGRRVPNHELLNEKRGRVIDAATGAGIPDAKIIAMWLGASSGIGGSSGGCVLQRITTTGADGSFTIPSVKSDLDISDRGTHGIMPFTQTSADFSWGLIVFKPGYVREGDMKSFEINSADPTRAGFDWESEPPDVKFGFGTVWVKDVRMQKANMDFEKTVLYYAEMGRATHCSRKGVEQPALHEIFSTVAELVRPLPCQLPSTQTVRAAVAMDFVSMIGGKKVAVYMDSEEQKRWPWTDTTAGVLCRAVHAGDTAP